MRRLRVRAAAGRDVRDAARWYETQRPGLGDRFVAEVDRLFARVAEAPLQFPEIADDVHRALLKAFPYAVYFAIDAEMVIVLAVLHLHRRPDEWRRLI